MTKILKRWLHELSCLFWPLNCISCDKVGVDICDECMQSIEKSTTVSYVENIPVISAVKYAGSARQLVLKWKDHGRLDVEHVLQKLLFTKTYLYFREFYDTKMKCIVVVYAPSSRKSVKRRGRVQTKALANAVHNAISHAVSGYGVKVLTLNLLKQKSANKQVRISASMRTSNKHGNIVLSKRELRRNKGILEVGSVGSVGSVSSTRPAGSAQAVGRTRTLPLGNFSNQDVGFVIVDDIVTTGSTLFECAKTLEKATGNKVILGMTFAAAGVDVAGGKKC